jgi:hypothetical protein
VQTTGDYGIETAHTAKPRDLRYRLHTIAKQANPRQLRASNDLQAFGPSFRSCFVKRGSVVRCERRVGRAQPIPRKEGRTLRRRAEFRFPEFRGSPVPSSLSGSKFKTTIESACRPTPAGGVHRVL